MKLRVVLSIFVSLGFLMLAESNGQEAMQGKSDSMDSSVPLPAVIEEVRGALNDYQTEAGASGDLLRLKTADFDFKTVTKVNGTAGFSILIFTFKHSREKDQTKDLQFHYEVPAPVKVSSYHPVELRKALLDLLRDASHTMQSSDVSLGDTKLKTVSITVEYAVTSSTTAEGKPVIHFITLDLGASYSKNEVQSLKLVFERRS